MSDERMHLPINSGGIIMTPEAITSFLNEAFEVEINGIPLDSNQKDASKTRIRQRITNEKPNGITLSQIREYARVEKQRIRTQLNLIHRRNSNPPPPLPQPPPPQFPFNANINPNILNEESVTNIITNSINNHNSNGNNRTILSAGSIRLAMVFATTNPDNPISIYGVTELQLNEVIRIEKLRLETEYIRDEAIRAMAPVVVTMANDIINTPSRHNLEAFEQDAVRASMLFLRYMNLPAFERDNLPKPCEFPELAYVEGNENNVELRLQNLIC